MVAGGVPSRGLKCPSVVQHVQLTLGDCRVLLGIGVHLQTDASPVAGRGWVALTVDAERDEARSDWIQMSEVAVLHDLPEDHDLVVLGDDVFDFGKHGPSCCPFAQ